MNFKFFSGFAILLGLCLAMAWSCQKKDSMPATDVSSSDSTTSELSQIANTASEQVIAVAQNLDSVSYARREHFGPKRDILSPKRSDLLIQYLYAATCDGSGGSSTTSCSSPAPYTIVRTYNDCTLGSGGLFTLAGSATYTYSASGCSMIGLLNRTVTRTGTLTLSAPTGAKVVATSTSSTDYRGNTFGGGQRLTVSSVAASYTLDVLGYHRSIQNSSGSTVLSISTRTTTGISASGTSLSNLVLNGGALEIINNTTQAVTTFALSNVSFSASCVCPISGCMSGTMTGVASGTATISFTGCGTGTISTSGGLSENFSVSSCASL